jgi:hypothetical protein
VATAPLKRNFQPPIIDRPLADSGQLSQSWQAHFEAVAKSLNDDQSLQKTGGTMTGPLILAAAPTVALGAATKAYVDTAAAVSLAALTARVVTLESKVATLEAEGATLAAGASYANDTDAAIGGVSVGQKYRNGSIIMVRVT